MKLTICFYLVLITSAFSQEKLQVLHVEGEIRMNSSMINLKTGDEISGNPVFHFSNEVAKALLLSDTRGRLVLFQNKSEEEPSGELVYYLKNNILPHKDYTGSRGDEENTDYLFFDKNILIIPKKIKVFKIPSSKSSFYELRFEVGNKKISKRLDVSPDGFLKLQKSTFKELSNKNEISSDFEMYYFQNKNKSYVHLTKVTYKGIQIATIREEIDIYKKWLKENGKNDLDQKVKTFLKSTYGPDLSLSHLKP